jgi:hypothetical protein
LTLEFTFFSKIHFNVIVPSVPVFPKWFLSMIFSRRILYHFIFNPYMMHILPISSFVISSP